MVLNERSQPMPPRAAPRFGAPLRPPLIEWREEWTLEVGFMDEDHRNLAIFLNELAREWGPAGDAEGGSEVLLASLEELGHHTREHFRREEEVMRTLRYPDLPAHKSEHDLLLADLVGTVRGLRRGGAASLDTGTLHALKDWLIGHVLEMDRPLAEFLKHPRDDGLGDGG